MDNEIRVELERIRDEDQRQNRRIELLEESVKANQELATSVHLLAHDMKQMLEEQRSQGNRLDKLEQEPATAWKKTKTAIITGVIGSIAGSMATGLIFLLSQPI